MMLPFEIRSNKLQSIHIRSIGLEYSRYILQIVDGENNYYSIETEYTMVRYDYNLAPEI
jgi:hypothetical protein